MLVCAPSNVAVDNLVEKLVDAKFTKMLRLGHPARALPELQRYTLDAVLSSSDQYQLIEDIRNEIDEIKKGKKQNNRGELGTLYKELRERERKSLKQILKDTQIVLSTLTSAAPDGPLKHIINEVDNQFDVLIIDECSQALEAACWIALPYAPKCILAGDHLQLPPTIISKDAAKQGLEKTLMERLIKMFKEENIVKMLQIQYRMNEKIMSWPSTQLYNGKLAAHESVAQHSLDDLIHGKMFHPIVLIDTVGCNMAELDVEDEESKGNEHEADIIAVYADMMVENGLNPSQIGIITPYNLQVELIKSRIREKHPLIEIKSVDGFQGREKEVILLSLVRSNDKKEIGFLSDFRRINVAVTRAKRHLVCVCDSDTVSNDHNLKSFIEYVFENGEVKCAQEFCDKISNLGSFDRPHHLKFKNTETKKKKKSKTSKSEKKLNQTKFEHVWKDEENLEDVRIEKIRSKIENFISDDSRNVINFSKVLNAYERRIVHEIAENFNLIHESYGEGEERYVIVKKVNEEKIESQVPQATVSNVSKSKPSKKVSKSESTTKAESKLTPENKLKDVKKISLKENLKESTEDDFDSLIAAAIKLDNSCAFIKCKVKTHVLGQTCKFCGHRFCMSHGMPEIHGCGQLAKIQARITLSKEGKIYPGSGVPTKKIDPNKRMHLERKLNKKITEMSNHRKWKKNEQD